MKLFAISLIFGVSYLLIAMRRVAFLPLGRPGLALVGATAMVSVGALDAQAALDALDLRTLLLLFAMMGLGVCFERASLFASVERMLARPALSPRALLHLIVLVAGALSAFLLNDTVCLFLAPIVCVVCVERDLPLPPYLLALATSANIGSAATLVGNPQNMIIGSIGPLSFGAFALAVGPAALVGLVINSLLLELYFGRALASAGSKTRAPTAHAPRAAPHAVVVLVCVVAGFFSGLDVVLVGLVGLSVSIIAERKEPTEVFQRIDWPLLVFFGGLFVLVAGFRATGLPARAFDAARPFLDLRTPGGAVAFSAFTLIGSNLFSNVPLVALMGPWLRDLPDAPRGFALLGFVSTVAGNLTLLGSVANLIVAERARHHHELGFWEYLRFGALSTLVVLAVGVPLVWWCT